MTMESWLDYTDGPLACRGWLVDGDAAGTSRPGVVLFPDARGMGEAAKECARRLAGEGHVVLVADLYGHATFVEELPDAVRLMNELRGDVTRWRQRAQAALEALARQAGGDRRKLAAIGYCFGGSTALELARSGAALGAVVSFHGGLASPRLEDAVNIKAKVRVLHGAADPLVPPRGRSVRHRDGQNPGQLAALLPPRRRARLLSTPRLTTPARLLLPTTKRPAATPGGRCSSGSGSFWP